MSGETVEEKPTITKKIKTKADKQAEHIGRIERTLIASLLGIGTGVLSYIIGGTPNAAGIQNDGFVGVMFMLAGIVSQRTIFLLLRMDPGKLGAKDWFYQAFMTAAFWFMTWAILLTWYVSSVPK